MRWAFRVSSDKHTILGHSLHLKTDFNFKTQSAASNGISSFSWLCSVFTGSALPLPLGRLSVMIRMRFWVVISSSLVGKPAKNNVVEQSEWQHMQERRLNIWRISLTSNNFLEKFQSIVHATRAHMDLLCQKEACNWTWSCWKQYRTTELVKARHEVLEKVYESLCNCTLLHEGPYLQGHQVLIFLILCKFYNQHNFLLKQISFHIIRRFAST